jgi:uncharacterized protein YycO
VIKSFPIPSKGDILPRVKPCLKEGNDLDFHLLEPGDLLLVANPTDLWLVRYLLFWSHVGVVTEDGVVDAIRDPRGEHIEEQQWGTVQCAPFTVYRANHDIIALRVLCPRQKRYSAARYAMDRVGFPYSPSLRQVFFARTETAHYSCGSLAWQAYKAQGVDLDPLRCNSNVIFLPGLLLRSPSVQVIAHGTRYRPIPKNWRNLSLILQRVWFSRVLRANVEIMMQ